MTHLRAHMYNTPPHHNTYLHGHGEEEGADDRARVLAGRVHHRALEQVQGAGASPVAPRLRLFWIWGGG